MILSVSKRTDIPAFYSQWFMNCIRRGSFCYRNPMNPAQVLRVPLSPENVDCIVFWTKDAKNIMQYLPELDKLGYKYYFQFTITPYSKDIESNIRNKKDVMETFKELSLKIGKEKIIYRYDPILITDKYSVDFHINTFKYMVSDLADYTKSTVISFVDDYRKISSNMKMLNIKEMTEADMIKIADSFSKITKQHNLKLMTCAEKINLEQFGIEKSKCIDGDLIERIIGCSITHKNTKYDKQRMACGCIQCIDMGNYDTCIHGCVYCYANVNKQKAKENFKLHNPKNEIMLGNISNEKIINKKDTESFKKEQTLFGW